MRIAVTRRIPEAGLQLLAESVDISLWEGTLPPSRDELLALAEGADGLLTLLTDRVDGALLDRLPSVRVVSNFAVGFDNIDVSAATARGIAVCTTPDVLTDTTADLAFALLLSVARRVKESADAVQAGEWPSWDPMGFLGQDVFGATLGIVGMGRIGRAVARRAQGFDMRILYTDRGTGVDGDLDFPTERVDLETLLLESDFVSLHVPLTPETQGLIGRRELELMKRSAILINTARGKVVDTEALADALEGGLIWGAGLDVTEPEPLPAAHRLPTLPRVIVTPHIGSGTASTRSRMGVLAARNVLAVLHGETPPRCLNPEVLGHARG